MSDTVIRVENLSKKYILGHQKQESYTTLRDSIASSAKSLLNPFQRKSQISDSNSEEFWALNNVSFEIEQGDRVGIIGGNGAGKSTLLKILSRIVEPTQGKIRMAGRVASLLEVGTGFHPELTGRENIFLNGAILGMDRVEITRKFDEIVAFAEVERFLDTPVKRYSSGMYVRLAFAVAAHLEPEILIVDEVLAVGDAQFQKKCLGKMEDVSKEGKTIIFVSHQMSTIEQLCHRVIWLNKGQIVHQGDASQILSKYLTQSSSDRPIVCLEQPIERKEILFTKITLLNNLNEASTELDVKSPFTINLNYEVVEAITEVEISIRIKTSEGTSVFTTVYSDASDKQKMDKTPGLYQASVQIPELFLMPGSYTISFAAFQFKRVFRLISRYDDMIRFRVCETGTKIAKYNDHRNIGVILVELPWQEEKIYN
ncbi:ABC transporter ATP-binding protein [Chamaesiphon sp. VAR_48_metabat_403]|uniref:ABC transporter ATP-binding protein n=1 Tax=Chamaesiphon sp. VAR_48_metabat_403 TaxID=2964700 RepID=UPI00286EA171|nr:ABC transporter ATP-binding protein [Chamaesiphon sp. VAR_48_metabat_403]